MYTTYKHTNWVMHKHWNSHTHTHKQYTQKEDWNARRFYKCNWLIKLLCLFTFYSQPLGSQAVLQQWRHHSSLQSPRLEKSLFGVFIQLKFGNVLHAQKLFGNVLYGFLGIELVYFEQLCFVSLLGCFKEYSMSTVFD